MHRHPDTGQYALGRQARQLFDAQQFDAAGELLASLADSVPDNPCVRMDLATVLLRCGRPRASSAQLLKAAQSPALDALLAMQLARGLFYGAEIPAARACLDQLEAVADLPVPLLSEQAHLRWAMRDVPAARRMIDRALAAGADGPREFYLQAMLMQFAGELEAVGQVLATCLQRWPSYGDAAFARSNLRRQTPQAHHVDALRVELARLPSGTREPAALANRAAFEAALFKELDDLGQDDQAWAALSRCNALMQQVSPYRAEGEAAIVDALIEASAPLVAQPSVIAAEAAGPQPIFIVGMPRSGTTLLDRMLSSHSQVASAGEISDFLRQLRYLADVTQPGVQGTLDAIARSPGLDLAELGARYLSNTQWRAQGRRYFVDKLPLNIRMVAHIRQALPHARIVHLVRDPMEVCFSNLSVLFGNSSPYSYDQGAMAHYYGQYARLADHWRALMPRAMLEVSYAELVQQPAATLATVLDYCGLTAEDACLHPERNTAPVATPSSVQVREPIHTRGLDRWHRYAQHLGVLRQAMSRFE